MYRDDRWEKGMYADDLVKFQCGCCGDEFIAARSAVEKANTNGQRICCPYCSSRYLEEQVSTDGEDMEDLSDAMGCLAIYISRTLEKGEDVKKVNYQQIYKEFLIETKIDEQLIQNWALLPLNKEWEPIKPYTIAIYLKNGGRLTYTSKEAPFDKVI